MDTGSYTFKALSSKYKDFRGPAFTIKVDGTELESSRMPIIRLEVELCADGSAGGCHFEVESLFDSETGKWMNNLEKTIKVGAKLEIQGGYVKQEEIFYGYVDEFSMHHSGHGPPRLSVTGIDGLGFLMHCQQPIYGGQKEPKKVVETILDKAIAAGYAKKKTVGALSGISVLLVKEKIDDYQYLRFLAEQYCMSVFVVAGEMIFDNVIKNSSPLIALTPDAGLLDFQKRTSLRGQVGKVEIWGRDVNNQYISGTANSVSVGGSGKAATEIATAFKETAIRQNSEYVKTEEECVSMAQAKLDSIAMNFIAGQGICVGIPELIPGRFVTIKELGEAVEGSYFITKVRHRFSKDGYYTTFEVKGAKG